VSRLNEARLWQRRKFEAGWAGIAWPSQYGGRGGSPIEQAIFDQEEAAFDVLGDALVVGLGWCGPALLLFGDERQRQRFLPPLLSGDELWCQLFSEPDAGSDLAGLSTRAEKDGDEWVISGEKVWTTFAHRSELGLCIARHDAALPKHRGLTAFVVDMRSAGVEARPIKQMTGAANFNQVHLDGVRVPDENRVGEPGDGWRVVITTFMFERIGASFASGLPGIEALRAMIGHSPLKKDQFTQLWIRQRVLSIQSLRTLTALSQGKVPGPEGSLGKLSATQTITSIYTLGIESLGAGGMLAGKDATGEWADAFLGAPGLRIGGGTDDVQRNIIAERILGLPGDLPAGA
jgi:alkylation response protein AidB-like acyl-CoA dehydrogenase